MQRLCEAALKQIPDAAKPFVLTTARNLLIDRIRQEQVIPIDRVIWMLEALDSRVPIGHGPDRILLAREGLRRLQAALDLLPPRIREAVVSWPHQSDLSRSGIAARMGDHRSVHGQSPSY